MSQTEGVQSSSATMEISIKVPQKKKKSENGPPWPICTLPKYFYKGLHSDRTEMLAHQCLLLCWSH